MNSLYKQIQELELNYNMTFINFSYIYIYFQLQLFNKNLYKFDLQVNINLKEEIINTLFTFVSFILFGTHEHYQLIHNIFYFILDRYKIKFNDEDTYNFVCQIFNTYFNIKIENYTKLIDNTIYLSYFTNNNSFTPINLPITFFQLGFINKNNNNINDFKKWDFFYFRNNYETQINYLNDIFPVLFEDNEIEFLKNNTMKLTTTNGQGKIVFSDNKIHLNGETQLFLNIKQQIFKSTEIILQFWGFDINQENDDVNQENDDVLINPIITKNSIDQNVIRRFELLANSERNCKLLIHILFCLQLFNLTKYSFAILLKIKLTLINDFNFEILNNEYVEKYLQPCLNVPNLLNINRQQILDTLTLILHGQLNRNEILKKSNKPSILKQKNLAKPFTLDDIYVRDDLLNSVLTKYKNFTLDKNLKASKLNKLWINKLINDMDEIALNTAINQLATNKETLKEFKNFNEKDKYYKFNIH